LEHAECFRADEDPSIQFLIGISWVLALPEDAEGALAWMLPGECLRFDLGDLICTTLTDQEVGRRYWEA